MTQDEVTVLSGDSLLLMDEKWHAFDRASRAQLKLTRKGTTTIAQRRSTSVALTKTVTNHPDHMEARWDFDIKPDPRGRHIELCVRVAPGVLDGLKPKGATHGYLSSSEELLLPTFLGRFTLDVRGSTWPWNLDDMRRVAWAKVFRLRVAPPYDPARGCRGTAILRVTTSPTSSPAFVHLDVAAAGNRGLVDETEDDGKGGWTDQGHNDLRMFRPGLHSFLGLPFRAGDRAVVLQGRERPKFPQTSPAIAVGGKAQRIYFLHTAAWSAKWREPVAQYRIRYADGQQATVPVLYGVDVNDWWGAAAPLDARVAWRGDNGQAQVGLYLMRWINPRPDAQVDSLIVQSTGSGAVPILLAATAIAADGLTTQQLGLLDKAYADRGEVKVSTEGWFPAPIAWKDGIAPGTALDVSFLNHTPAGQLGFVQVRGGRFVFGERPDEPVRFWGTNAALHGPYPPKADAPGIAKALARQGVNMVRMHLYAVYEGTMIAADGSLNQEGLDLFEFFIAELKKAGVYVYMDLNDGMFYDRLLGKRIAGSLKNLKMASLFNPDLIEAQKRLARQLFKHRNPYTGLAIVDDPAVALYEITNENSMTSTWGSLKSRVPEPYYSELEGLWKRWLAQRGKPERPLGMTLGDDAPDARRFAAELQKRYLDEMYDFLHELGVKAPICGTNITFTLGDLWASQRMDYTNDHAYWDHGNVRARPMTFRDRPAMAAAAWSMPMIPHFARAKVRGKPVVASEWNYVFPNNYRCEGLPTMAAYASYQDWDGLLFYCATGSFNGGRWSWFAKSPGILVHTQQTDPATWGLSQLSALIFRRRDVATARRAVTLSYDDSRVWANESVLSQMPFLPALARVETRLAPPAAEDWCMSQDKSAAAEQLYPQVLEHLANRSGSNTLVVSDTGQIRRDTAEGVLTVDTPRTQIAAGFLASVDRIQLSDVEFACETRFATLGLASLDGLPLRRSERMLLVAVANARNQDTRFEAGRLFDMGKGPVIAEPVAAAVLFPPDPSLHVHALDTLTSQRKAAVAVRTDARTTVHISGEHKTIYYEVTR